MPEKQKEVSSEKEKSPEQSRVAVQNNEVEVSSLKKMLGNGTIGKLSKLKRSKNTGETSVEVVEDKVITLGKGSTEITAGDGKNTITSGTSGLTVKRGKTLSGSIGITNIVGENGQGNIETHEGLLGVTLTKKF